MGAFKQIQVVCWVHPFLKNDHNFVQGFKVAFFTFHRFRQQDEELHKNLSAKPPSVL